jgi:ketosteroid isomerase-like protein
MSQENVDVVLALHAAVSRWDLDGVLALAHPQVEYRSAIQQAMEGEGSVFRGPAGIRRWFGELQDLYEYLESEVQEVHDFGERVVIVFVVSGRGAGSGIVLEQPLAQVVTVRQGQIVSVHDYFSREEALAAVGAEPPSSPA